MSAISATAVSAAMSKLRTIFNLALALTLPYIINSKMSVDIILFMFSYELFFSKVSVSKSYGLLQDPAS